MATNTVNEQLTGSHYAQRQVVLDTETTGMNQEAGKPHFLGHNVIEIGAVEMRNRRLTGRTFHVYIKPDRSVDPEAVKVHGITDEMLADKPHFAEIIDEFIEFIRDAELIIHNAPFDVGFLDYEFSKLAQYATLKINDICQVTDSLALAKKKYPAKRNNLDALCERLGIDNSDRTLHGALLDAEILADVYLKMTGGQFNLFTDEQFTAQSTHTNSYHSINTNTAKQHNIPLIYPNEEEFIEHQRYLDFIQKKSGNNGIWHQYITDEKEKT